MNEMSWLEWLLLVIGPNVIAGIAMLRQRARHAKYREAIHALLADEGYAEGEPQAIVDEALRMTAHFKMPMPNARDFAHALIQQESFRKAVAHEALHDIYIQTHGRQL